MREYEIVQMLRGIIDDYKTFKENISTTFERLESLAGAIEFDMDKESEDMGRELYHTPHVPMPEPTDNIKF